MLTPGPKPTLMNFRNCILIFLIISIGSCKSKNPYSVSAINGKRVLIDTTITPDREIENYIKPFTQHLNSTLDSTLAYNPQDLSVNEGKLNSALGNLIADLVMEQANPIFNSRTGKNIDLVLLNHGGIRADIGKGNVSTRTAYQLMPFENDIVVVELSGKKILEMLKYLEKANIAHPLSGIQITMDKNYKIISATISNARIEEENTYLVATSDYLQQGGDSMFFFKDPVNLFTTDYKLRNAIIDYFVKVDTLNTAIDNRFIQYP